ncbi:hypothetical protein AURDEDRAFT_122401 [Auricularia subglabra TFB-10046 SS5]|nr:hypothetical protein AURDEDRAFT_122401 [Auricularia subglabra TFB-10046 SS5]
METVARDLVLGTPELRDMVFSAIACPQTFCRLRCVSKQFLTMYHDAMDSLYTPTLFAGNFFSNNRRAIDLVQYTGAVMTGSAVRQYMYDLAVGTGWLVFMVNEDHADLILDFVQSEGFVCYDTFTPFDPVHPRVCRRALVSYRYIREDKGKELRVSVQLALHDPLRLLLNTTRPYAMQGCDGYRFFDLYPKLGRAGPPLAVCNGKHAHLLSPQECLDNLPSNTFSLETNSLVDPSISFIERWIGDSQSWVTPIDPDAPSYSYLRVNDAEYHHFWTDTVARCLRHNLLRLPFVGPPPAVAYAKRVLDRIRDSLATGSPEVLGPHQGVITDYDTELDHILDCYRVGFDYQYTASDEPIAVDRSYCTYDSLP